jgi:hypothetical protein
MATLVMRGNMPEIIPDGTADSTKPPPGAVARLLILLSLVLRNSQQYVPINSYLMDFGQKICRRNRKGRSRCR